MAATHQTEQPVATPPDTTIVQPRANDPGHEVSPETAAREAKERMSKTQGFWNRLAPEKEEAKPEKPAEAQPEKPPKKKDEPAVPAEAEATEDEPKEEPTKPKKASRKKEPEIDPIELARATGQEIGREMAKANQNANQNVPRGTKTEDVNVEVELPEEFRADVAVFEEMSRLDPKRYGNIKKELARYAQAESDYIAKWEKEHEGETFDGESDEHDAFYSKIRPNYEQKDFKAAEKSLLKKEVRQEVSEELRTREAETERRRERASQIQPEIQRDMVSLLGDMIREADPANADLGKDWASIQTLDEKNPLLSDVMVTVHNETKPAIEATLRLFRGVDQPDPKNAVHQRVFSLISEAEQRVSRLPMKDRYDDDGRLFATQEDYAKMSPTEKARHWYVGEREAVALLKGQAIAQTKTIYERESQRIARYTKRNNATEPAEPSNHAAPKKAEPAQQPKPDNGSPSVTGRGTLPGDGQSASSKPTGGREMFFSKMFGA